MTDLVALTTYGPFRSRMEPLWQVDTTLYGGTQALRDAGVTYLPKFEMESDRNYDRRKSLACLTNFYVKAASSMLGEVFHDEPLVAESTVAEDFLENVDMRGNSIGMFAQKIADMLLRKACALVVVDHPFVERELTLADERRLGLRHYWTLVRSENVIDVRAAYINGREEIVHARWYEDSIRPGTGDFGYDLIRNVIVMDRPPSTDDDGMLVWGRPRGRRYVQVEENTTQYTPQGDWVEFTRIDRLPVEVFQVNRERLFEGKPPLADIAEKNIQHWRQSSNYGNALEIGSFPILARFGARSNAPLPTEDDMPKNDRGEVLIGPHVIINMPATTEGADLRYVEPSGAAYSALERALDRIISEAEIMALDLLVKRGNRTATEATYDRLQQMAPLQVLAYEVERGVSELLAMTAQMRGRNETPGYLSINKDFGISTSDAIRVQALRDSLAAGVITGETYLKELKALGALSASLDPARETAQAEAQMQRMIGVDNVGGGNAPDTASAA